MEAEALEAPVTVVGSVKFGALEAAALPAFFQRQTPADVVTGIFVAGGGRMPWLHQRIDEGLVFGRDVDLVRTHVCSPLPFCARAGDGRADCAVVARSVGKPGPGATACGFIGIGRRAMPCSALARPRCDGIIREKPDAEPPSVPYSLRCAASSVCCPLPR